MSRDRAGIYLSVFLILLTATAVYSNVYHAPFVFDDISNIAWNPYVTDLKYIPQFFLGSISHPLRAVGYTTFALNHHWEGLNPSGYHAVNILLHMANALLVFFLVRKTLVLAKGKDPAGDTRQEGGRPLLLPVLTALLFIAHPVQTMGVTYIVQRNGLLATFFVLLMFFAAIKAIQTQGTRRAVFGGGAFLCFLLAMWSKEIAVTAPPLLLIYAFYFMDDGDEPFTARIKGLLPLFFLFALALACAFYVIDFGRYLETWLHPKPENEGMGLWGMGQNLLTQFNVVIAYIALLFYPSLDRLNADRDFPLAESLFAFPTAASFVCIMGLLGVAFHLRKRLPVVSFGVLWFFIALSPDSSIIPLEDIMVEYRLYLPSIGFFLAFVAGLDHAVDTLLKREGFRRIAVAAPLAALILLAAVTAWERNRVWGDKITFWADAVSKSPEKARPHANLGKAYYEAGMLKEAVTSLRQARALSPRAYVARFNLGVIYHQNGRLNQAVREYEAVLKVKPSSPKAHHGLALIRNVQGAAQAAIGHYRQAMSIAPEDPLYHYNAALIYENAGCLGEALKEYEETLRADAAHEAARERIGKLKQMKPGDLTCPLA